MANEPALGEDEADDIEFLYWDMCMTTEEVADAFGVSQPTLLSSMDRLGIDRREPGGAAPDSGAPWRDGDVLHKMYHGEGMTQAAMADELGCSAATIRRHMRKNGIEGRAPDWRERERCAAEEPAADGG